MDWKSYVVEEAVNEITEYVLIIVLGLHNDTDDINGASIHLFQSNWIKIYITVEIKSLNQALD